jgi:hypothetical protein
MLAPEVCAEVRVGDVPLALIAIRTRLRLSMRLIFLPALITVTVIVIFPALHVAVATLLVLWLAALALRSGVPTVSAFRLLILPVFRTGLLLGLRLLLRSRLILPIFRMILLCIGLPIVLPGIVWPVVLMLILG